MNATLGQALSSRRREWGLSHDEVTRATRISRQQLQWMEDDELANFPGRGYAVANVRRYCEALELDYRSLEPLVRMQLARMPSEHLDARVLMTPVAYRKAVEPAPRSATAGSALAAAALAVFLVASTVTAMHIANVKTVTEPAPLLARPLPPYAGEERGPLLAGPGVPEHIPAE